MLRFYKQVLILLTLMSTFGSYASLSLSAKPIIFIENSHKIPFQIINKDELPVFTYLWVDEGDKNIPPKEKNKHFKAMPGKVKIKGTTVQRIYIVPTSTRPMAEEQTFWLNVMEVPDSAINNPNDNAPLLRHRIKLIYRTLKQQAMLKIKGK